MTINENKEDKQSALKAMVEKLDNRQPGTAGYNTTLPELQEILSQLTPRVPVSILESRSSVDREKDVSVEIRIRFTLERELL